MGNALKQQGKLDEAIAHYRQAITFKCNSTDVHLQLGNALLAQHQLDEAIAEYQQVLNLQENSADAYNNMGKALREQGKLSEAIAHYQQALTLDPQLSLSHSNLLLALHYQPNPNPQAIFASHQNWAEVHAAPLAATRTPFAQARCETRRLKIGYVSPDFCTHSVAFFIEPVLTAHDKTQFEVFCYANVPRTDETTKRLQQLACCWRNIWGINDEQVSEIIRADGIDILVDLARHHHNLRSSLDGSACYRSGRKYPRLASGS